MVILTSSPFFLYVQIELIDWKVEDLSPNKNKGILRHIFEMGTGDDSPKDGALVTGIEILIL